MIFPSLTDSPSLPARFRARAAMLMMCLLLIPLVAGGCSAVRWAKDTVGLDSTDEAPYRKKIAVVGVANRTFFQSEEMNAYAESLDKRLTKMIEANPRFKVMDSDTLALLMDSGDFGRDDSHAVLQFGRTWGLNAFVRASISELTYRRKKFGIYGFRDEVPTMQVVIQIKVVDPETGTVLYQGQRSPYLKIDNRYDNILQYIEEKKSPPEALLAESLDELTEEAVEALERQPWKTFVVESSGSTFRISSGSEVGLTEGAVLEVREKGEEITNYYGETFLMPGPPLGRVRLVECKELFCVGEPLDGTPVHVGDTVRYVN